MWAGQGGPRFWSRLVDDQRLDPRITLVVGDHQVADREAPAAAGLQSRLVRPDGIDLGALVADLEAAGIPPPASPVLLAGDHEHWAGRKVVVAPHLRPLVARTTRTRVRFAAGAATGVCVVVRRSSAQPAVVSTGKPLPGAVWLSPGRERARYVVPADLADVLTERGLSLDVLSPAERRHALSLVHEARSATTVAERTADLVRFLEERGEEDSRS